MTPFHVPRSRAVILLAILGVLVASRGLADPEQPKQAGAVLEGRGYIVPVQVVQVGSEIRGQVIAVNFEEGQHVKKGDLLARLDPTRFEIDVKRAEAMLMRARAQLKELETGPREEEIKQAEAEVMKAQAERDLARDLLERLRRLAKEVAPVEELRRAEAQLRAAEIQLEKAKAALQALKNGPRKERVDAAKAELMAAEADLERARYQLERTHIRAPINGVVLRKNVEAGNLVHGAAFPFGSHLCELADLTKLEVDVPVSERDVTRVFVGQRCEIRTDAFPNLVHKGQVARFLPVFDRARACMMVRVRIEGLEEGKLRPEMSAQVKFLPKE